MRRLAFLTLILLLAGACSGPDQPQGKGAFPPFYPDGGLFLAAIHHCRGQPLPQKITGVTVPHHLLAADLIAGAFARVQGHHYRRIVILSPDHFHRSRSPFAVTRRDFDTVLGRLTTDRAAVDQLLNNPLVTESSLFSHEHGVRALLPFIVHYFPKTPIVPIAIRHSSRPADWDSLARTLAPLLTPDTLLVQSTDFSHYLTQPEARRRDQETLRVLSGGDPPPGPEPHRTGSFGLQGLPIPATSLATAGLWGRAHGHRQPQFPGIHQRAGSQDHQLYRPTLQCRAAGDSRSSFLLLRGGHLLRPLCGEKAGDPGQPGLPDAASSGDYRGPTLDSQPGRGAYQKVPGVAGSLYPVHGKRPGSAPVKRAQGPGGEPGQQPQP